MSPLHTMAGSECCIWITIPTFHGLTLEEMALDLVSVWLGKDKTYVYCSNIPKEWDTCTLQISNKSHSRDGDWHS